MSTECSSFILVKEHIEQNKRWYKEALVHRIRSRQFKQYKNLSWTKKCYFNVIFKHEIFNAKIYSTWLLVNILFVMSNTENGTLILNGQSRWSFRNMIWWNAQVSGPSKVHNMAKFCTSPHRRTLPWHAYPRLTLRLTPTIFSKLRQRNIFLIIWR